MRKIKFRAWDKLYKHFHEEDLVNDYVLGDFINNPEYEVTQFTGSKDKVGNEIYEGDLVTDQWENIDVIRWHETFGMYYTCPLEAAHQSENEIENSYSLRDLVFINNTPKLYLTVIGNIFEYNCEQNNK